jgi:hypothetical protein
VSADPVAGPSSVPDTAVTLRDLWELRRAAAATLLAAEEQFARLLRGATPEQVTELLERFSPTHSSGPEWSRSFDLVIEHIWAWCSNETLALVEAEFRGRGPSWAGIANALSAQHGTDVRQRLGRRFPQARLASFTIT